MLNIRKIKNLRFHLKANTIGYINKRKNLISELKSDFFFILSDDQVDKISEIYSEHEDSFSSINLSLFTSGLSKSENID